MNKRVLALALVGAFVAATIDHALAGEPSPGSPPPAVPIATASPPAVQLAARNLREACRAWPTHIAAPDPSRRPVSNPPGDEAALCDAATHPRQFTWQIGAALAMLALCMLVLFGFAMQAVLSVTKGIRGGISSFRGRAAS